MNTFPKNRRLLRREEYDNVFQQSSKLTTPNFIILYRKNSFGYARLGLVISKKAIAKACQRNRIKRLLRETFRTSQLSAWDIVVLAKRGTANVQNALLIPSLHKVWDKLSK